MIRRKTNRRHMTGDHHGQTAGTATPLVRAVDEISGTHRFKFFIRDRDSKFTAAFDLVLAGSGVRVITTPVRSPRANSFAERYGGTLRHECLDHLLIYGEQHLRRTPDRVCAAL